jgi:invasion protein IalB
VYALDLIDSQQAPPPAARGSEAASPPPGLRATDKDWLCLLLKNSASSTAVCLVQQQQFSRSATYWVQLYLLSSWCSPGWGLVGGRDGSTAGGGGDSG